jgi:hypothetical protein
VLWRDATRLRARKQNSNETRADEYCNRLGIKSVREIEKESEAFLSATEKMIDETRINHASLRTTSGACIAFGFRNPVSADELP